MRIRNVFSILSMITLTAFTSGLAGVPFVGVPMAHAIDNRGTEAQQLACTPDVFRFCGSQIPDVDRIVVCLRQNMTSLSNGCRAVFDAEASMQTENKPAAVAAKPQQRTASPKPAARAPQPAPMPPPPNPSVDDNDD